jgi:hypothetical protein
MYNPDGKLVDYANVEVLYDGQDGLPGAPGNSTCHVELSNEFD